MGRRNQEFPAGLSRVDHEASGVRCWRVQTREGDFLYFGDASFGGKDQSLLAALSKLVSLPVIGVGTRNHCDSKTGVAGVSPITEGGRIVGYKAQAGGRSKLRIQTFRFSEFGQEAESLAIAARKQMLAEVEVQATLERNEAIANLLKKMDLG